MLTLIGSISIFFTMPKAATGTIDYTQTMTIFAGFGVVAILIAFLLLFEDKRKGYGLQKPNVK